MFHSRRALELEPVQIAFIDNRKSRTYFEFEFAVTQEGRLLQDFEIVLSFFSCALGVLIFLFEFWFRFDEFC